MLVEFKVSNFQCFRDEATLSMVAAGQDQTLLGNTWEGKRYRAVKSAGIFGANASGKSSLLRALQVLRMFVVKSATHMTIGDPIPGIDPFRLSDFTQREPSCFEIAVELEGVGFRYRVEATREKVLREKFEHQGVEERSRWLTLIDRDESRKNTPSTLLHDKIGSKARRDQLVEDTRGNSLVLSRAAERNVECIVPFFRWIREHIRHTKTGMGASADSGLLRPMAGTAAKDRGYLNKLLYLIRDADTGISALRTESVGLNRFTFEPITEIDDEEIPVVVKDAISQLSTASLKLVEALESENSESIKTQFYTEHASADSRPTRFELEDESTGTLRYWALAGQLLRQCQDSNLIVVDELDASLHPQLSRRIVQLAHSPEFNRSGAQLIFSTHDVTLMDPALLRRDQLYLTQKNAEGASELYSLWDFEDGPRKDSAWAKNYLAGRFGGVPVFGPTLADIPQADCPTEVQSIEAHSVGAD